MGVAVGMVVAVGELVSVGAGVVVAGCTAVVATGGGTAGLQAASRIVTMRSAVTFFID